MRRKVVPKKNNGAYKAQKWCHFNCENEKQPTHTGNKGIKAPFLYKKVTGLLDCNLKRAVYSENIITYVRGTAHTFLHHVLFISRRPDAELQVRTNVMAGIRKTRLQAAGSHNFSQIS
jgi:hypothetical protein